MPKAKLELNADDLKRFPAAVALANGISIGEFYKAGGSVHQEISYKSPDQLVKLGQLMATVSEAEIKAYADRMAKKAAKKAEAVKA